MLQPRSSTRSDVGHRVRPRAWTGSDVERTGRHMLRTLLIGKIHRATVTHADLHYVGSLTIDANLMKAANIVEGEQVQIVDITNGARLETYAIPGEPGSGVIGVNGAAARLVPPGGLVIVITYGQFADDEIHETPPHGRHR